MGIPTPPVHISSSVRHAGTGCCEDCQTACRFCPSYLVDVPARRSRGNPRREAWSCPQSCTLDTGRRENFSPAISGPRRAREAYDGRRSLQSAVQACGKETGSHRDLSPSRSSRVAEGRAKSTTSEGRQGSAEDLQGLFPPESSQLEESQRSSLVSVSG